MNEDISEYIFDKEFLGDDFLAEVPSIHWALHETARLLTGKVIKSRFIIRTQEGDIEMD